MNLFFIVAYLSTFSPLLALGLSLRLKKNPKNIRLIQVLLGVSLIFDLTGIFLSRNGINAHPFGNLFSLIQAIVLLIIFIDALKIERFTLPIIFTYCATFIVNYFFIQTPFIFNSHSHAISSILFILFALLYFRQLLIEMPVVHVERMPMIWINIAVLIYYSGNLFLFILNNYFIHKISGSQGTIWIIHNILNISKNLLFLVAIWQSLRKTSLSSS